jgi:hypothetical protein
MPIRAGSGMGLTLSTIVKRRNVWGLIPAAPKVNLRWRVVERLRPTFIPRAKDRKPEMRQPPVATFATLETPTGARAETVSATPRAETF